MKAINLYLHIHQPFRYGQYSIFDIDKSENYWNDEKSVKQNNCKIFKKVAKKSYFPMLKLLEEKLEQYADFKFSLSITGVWLEQAESFEPKLIKQLQRIVATGRVELLAETYYHSLAFFYSKAEFIQQVALHRRKIKEVFGVKPVVFRNTELAYNNDLAKWVEKMGYKGVVAEGWDKILKNRSSNQIYKPYGCKKTKLLLKNYRLSDDIAFRFSEQNWKEWPLTVKKYQKWLENSCPQGGLINLFMDFETFGEHQWRETGIFEFFAELVDSWLKGGKGSFVTVAEACEKFKTAGSVSVAKTVTWADSERDLSAWCGNHMQDEAAELLYGLRGRIMKLQDEKLLQDFRRLTTSDHLYYMCTKYWRDGDVHTYFSAYNSPYEAFMYFMNVMRGLEYRVEKLEEELSLR